MAENNLPRKKKGYLAQSTAQEECILISDNQSNTSTVELEFKCHELQVWVVYTNVDQLTKSENASNNKFKLVLQMLRVEIFL